jgi:hypothetical protein
MRCAIRFVEVKTIADQPSPLDSGKNCNRSQAPLEKIMKTARANSSLVAIIALALASFTPIYPPAAAQNNPTVTKKELKALLKTAKEPVDHQRIAAYYHQEAARLTLSAKEHEGLAAIYKHNPPNPAMESKHGTSVEGATHCNRWAELATEQAKEAEALAALHEGMAKDAEKK